MHRVPVPFALTILHCFTTVASPSCGSLSCQMSPPSAQSKFTQPHRLICVELMNLHRVEERPTASVLARPKKK